MSLWGNRIVATSIETRVITTNPSITALSVSGSNIYAGTGGGGLFLSTNNGTNWTTIITDSTYSYVTALTVSGTNIFAGFYAGMLLSTDNGINWMQVNSLDNNIVTSFAVSGSNVYTGTYGGGVYLSSNSGTNWTQVSNGLLLSVTTNFALSGNNIFAGTRFGVFLSTNNGANWVQKKYGIISSFGSIISSLAVIHNNVFAGIWKGGIYISSNNGTNWVKVNNWQSDGIVISIISSENDIFASMGFYLFGGHTGVYHSTDNGINWSPVNNGLDTIYNNIGPLAVSGSNIFAGTGLGLFISTNNGSNWTQVNNGLTNTTDIFTLAANGSNVFAGTIKPFSFPYINAGMFLSTNNGINWALANNGLPLFPVNSLAFSGSNIFAAADSGGVYLSTNNGTDWTQVNNGLQPGTRVLAVAISGTNIFAGTDGAGVWKRPLSELTGVSNEVKAVPQEYTLFQNYPNPFNPSTVIKYTIPFESNVNVRFYNPLGQTVREVKEGNRQPGNYEINFNSSGLASGIYFYSIRAVSADGKNDFSAVKKMALLK